MRLFLKLLFGFIFGWMVVATVRTSLQVSLWDAWRGFSANPWAVATLYDAYAGFLTFYMWVVFKERGWGGRILWFVLIMCLGNIAMSAYVLRELFRLPAGEKVEAILWRRA
jgi:biotin transporter BioY